MKIKNDQETQYWSTRYKENKTEWDLGDISPPLKDYIAQLNDRTLKILIPGGGNSYEAEYLFNRGFKNVYVIDIAKEPFENFKKRLPAFPEENWIVGNFFDLKGKFDLIIEQTFFCTLPADKRKTYALKAGELLKNGGKVIGLLFKTEFAIDGPPFGGSKEEYLSYFSPLFHILVFENCYNSVIPRAGNELFLSLKKIVCLQQILFSPTTK